MANQKQLIQLKKGAQSWNKWREKYKNVLIDLSFANLSKAHLSYVNLHHANLIGIDLSGASLDHANLDNANLIYADLNNVDLNHAHLNNAQLYSTNLSKAILNAATLGGAILSTADLSDADLSGVDLSGALLIDAHLKNTKLSHSNLIGANLSRADLKQVDLSQARLTSTVMNDTILIGVNLSDTDLTYANLIHSLLREVDWTNVQMGWTQLNDLDLQAVQGLETVNHAGPSTIGLDTIYRSRGQIPEIFLRKAGVPETFITNMRALVESMSPIDFYSCFISYSHKNQDFVERLYADLQNKGIRCWYALKDLRIGDHYHQRIEDSIRLYDKLILVLSEQAIHSPWVEREVATALEKEDQLGHEVLFPIYLDDAVLHTTKAWAASVRRRLHMGDFTRWREHGIYQVAFERLLRDLKTEHKLKR